MYDEMENSRTKYHGQLLGTVSVIIWKDKTRTKKYNPV
jgi:hypothetical protein